MKKISQYIGIIVSITLLAHSTVLCSAEPQKGRFARAWGATKEYVSKAAKRVGLDNPKEQARKRIQKYAGQAQAELKKFIACLEGKATCSRESIRKVRLYAAIVITAIAILAGIGYKISQKPKEGEIKLAAPERPRAEEEEEEEEEEGPIKEIVEASRHDDWQPFSSTFNHYVEKDPDLKIDWETVEGRTIAENVHKFWNKLPPETKYNLQKRGFSMPHDKIEDLESMQREEKNLRIINQSIDSLLYITGGHSNVDIPRAMWPKRDDYKALKDFLDGPLSKWIHENWRSFNSKIKQALARSSTFILNEKERVDVAGIEALQRGLEKAKAEAKEQAKAEE